MSNDETTTATPAWMVEVETLSRAQVIVRAETETLAIQWAKDIGEPSDVLDQDPTEYDWPTATARRVPDDAPVTGDAEELREAASS